LFKEKAMLSALIIGLAAAPMAREMPRIEPFKQGPMPAENIYLRPGHKNSDDRMFPDIAIGALSVDGDTLYVKLINKGRSRTETPIQIAARAEANGVRSDLAQLRIEGQLKAGESKWVALHGFSFKTASTSAPVFALENATVVSAAARLLPSTAGALSRSGQGCGACTTESDASNNMLTLAGSALGHGRPR
jgi:hypothetical protein